MILPFRLTPGFSQLGQTNQRLAGTFFIPSGQFPAILPLPFAIGATTVTTDVINVVGFNTFTAYMDVTGGATNIAFKVNAISPVDGATILQTVTVATVNTGTGLTQMNFGFGNAGLLASTAFILISLTFTGGGAGTVLNQFPGLFGCVR